MKDIRICLNPVCDRLVLGRSDKKYCCDGCRSAHYNDTKQEKKSDPLKRILKFQENNRDILREIFEKNEGKAIVSKSYLIGLGFNFMYHTHFMLTYKRKFLQCSFDYAIRVIDDYLVEVCRSIDDGPNSKLN
ncbi:hypothetical protein [Belliella aquatica]|uniref:Uncharacterized protein n=1 Tax=Belliella aquatica TaxID=1323734 RepID=A0ABQ1MJW7_9BACT|nr:hypothetical protein [Belliella aquatica]MCH7405051.1 hypothetical protein [Belliella aquatica]GGC40251.1 hypothetical protein GCM10010993_18670 [Belliella aquatica]